MPACTRGEIRTDGSREALQGDEDRAVRGGAHWGSEEDLRTFERTPFTVGRGNEGGGFRVAR